MQLKYFKTGNDSLQKTHQTDPYLHVSHIYPHLMDFISYKWWARYIYSITNKKITKNPLVLELAAGNCSLARHLSKLYKNYIATDISLSMLNYNDEKIKKICCDMTSIPYKK